MTILICLLGSIAILAIVFSISRRKPGAAGVCGVAVAGFAFSFLCISPFFFSLVLLLQCLLTLVAGAVCLVARAKPRVVFASSIGAALASYAFAVWFGYDQLRDRKQMLEQYAFQSMSARLAYETKNHPEASASSVPLSPTVVERLNEFENRESHSDRRFMLRVLHERSRDRFVLTSGFGVGRMARAKKERIELPKTEPVRLPSPSYVPEYDPTADRSVPLAEETVNPDAQPAKENLLAMHDRGLQEFLAPDRMGFIKSRERVAGFESHAFQHIPQVDPSGNNEQWQVTRLELVSLLKHDAPRVYVSENLPQMDELENAATRPLDDFEYSALEELRRTEDLVFQTGVNRIRMLGSLRAGKDCLECHSVQRGDLLGAFSYDLFRVRPIPLPKKSKPTKPHA